MSLQEDLGIGETGWGLTSDGTEIRTVTRRQALRNAGRKH